MISRIASSPATSRMIVLVDSERNSPCRYGSLLLR